MDSYKKTAIFHLPGMFKYPWIHEALLQKMQEVPHIFKDNVKIGSIYGSPTAIWNGGRLVLHLHPTKEELEGIRDMMQHYNIPVRFTFTNSMLEEKHLHDTFCNLILKIFDTGNNEIICNLPLLENYIREKYGDRYKYISSTTKRLLKQDDQKAEIEKDYHLIVLDYDYNKNFGFLKSIKNKDKCEILCNPVCASRCALRAEHYTNISKCQLEFGLSNLQKCPHITADTLWGAMQQSNYIGPEDINKYIDMGFSNFKLEGRGMNPLDFIETLTHYLIKTEYQMEIRSYLHDLLWRMK